MTMSITAAIAAAVAGTAPTEAIHQTGVTVPAVTARAAAIRLTAATRPLPLPARETAQ